VALGSAAAGPTILIVAAEFPPVKTIGRLRACKFAEHLRDDGWHPVVLTVAAGPDTPGYVPALESEVPAGVTVLRAPLPDFESRVATAIKRLIRHRAPSTAADPTVVIPSGSAAANPRSGWHPRELGIRSFKWVLRNWIEVPDNYGGWATGALTLARQYCRNQRVDVVFTTLPPFSSARIGYRLKAQFGIPWVVDYRDLWVGDVLREWIGPLRGAFEHRLERRYMRRADIIIAVSEQKTAFLQQHLPKAPALRETLTNGYDPEIFAPYLAEPRVSDAYIDFVFTGRLFKNRRGYAFAEALGQLAQTRPELRHRVRVHILGGVAPEIRAHYDRILTRYDLREVYRFAGDIPYHEAMRAQVQADYLLLIVDTGATSSGVIPGKLFEYVAARRPIFALVDPGATQEIIERGRLGTVVPAEDVAACRTALAQWLARDIPERLDADDEYLAQFDRRQISMRLSKLFDTLISPGLSRGRT
jgi:glycosyltransferase involved in cell wall biosynthesis